MVMFYQMIQNRANENTKNVVITKDNIETVWYPAWLNAADEILAEFEAEGLKNSAIEMRRIIVESRRSIGM